MIKWIIDNKEWVFSGFGVAIVTGLMSFILKKRSNRKRKPIRIQKSGNNSINIQEIIAKENIEININKEGETKDVK